MNVYLRLLWAYLKIGLFGFGGGYAMLSLIQSEVVASGWISDQTFTDIVAISQMTPGPIGINSATYIGYVVSGSVWGSLVATLAVVLPPFVLVLAAGHLLARHRNSAVVQGVFTGLRPVVVGLIAAAALLLCNSENFGTLASERCITCTICAVSLALSLFTRIHPIVVIVASGLAGLWLF